MTAVDSGAESETLAAARKALLESRLRGVRTSRDTQSELIPRRVGRTDGEYTAPLSASQLQLWYLSRLAPESRAYNELITVRKEGTFDPEAFRWAFNEFIRRHEAWRTTFEMGDTAPRQVIHPPVPFELPVIDLSCLSADRAESAATDLAAEDTRRPYDLAAGPLIRPHLVRLSETSHRLYLGIHHLIFDGVSLYRIFLPELVSLYNSRVALEPPLVAAPPVQYSDYSVWERNWSEGEEMASRVERCRARLEGSAPLELPLDRPRPPKPRFVGSVASLSIDARTVAALRHAAAGQGATLFHALTAAYAYWLQCYTGNDDVTFATPTDMRQRPELESMVGYCLTPTVLRAQINAERSFVEAIGYMRGEVLDALGRVVPFERLVRGLDLPRDPRLNPVFQSVLVLEPPAVSVDDEWSLHQMENAVSRAVGQSKFDLSLELDERSDGHLEGRLSYNTDIFDSTTIESMKRHFELLLRRCATEPTAVLGDLSVADADDAARQLREFNPPGIAGKAPATIHEYILARAARIPDMPAVTVGKNRLTYRGLVQRAQQIATRLSRSGAGPGTVVAVIMPRTIDLVPAILAVLMCGSAYLPIEPRHPVRRSRFMMGDAGASIVLTTTALVDELDWVDVAVLPVDGTEHGVGSGTEHGVGSCPDVNLDSSYCAATDLAYILYTSGSTGIPKGVQVEHRNVVDLMATLPAATDLGVDDTVLSVASYTFDMSVGDYFVTLGLGASLVVATTEQMHDPRRLAELIESSRATRMSATPTSWAALLAAGWAGRPGLLAASVGEPLPDALAASLTEVCAGVWNGWGPTETTVFAGGGLVRSDEPVTVGRPLPGTRVYVTDTKGRLLPLGVPGEIVIGGPGVSRGYLSRPEETAKRFGRDPFMEGERVYRSGDRGRLLSDGRLQHLGRFDNQVKIRGFRIELGEIECVLREHPGVAAAALDVQQDQAGRPRLAAFIVEDAMHYNECESEAECDAELRAWTRRRLPDYMVPAVIIRVTSLPTSPSGKLDRRALAELTVAQSNSLTTVESSAVETAGTVTISATPGMSETEVVIASLWSMLLGAEVVDVDRNFFDLGGHSLLAANLVAQIEHRMGVTVSLVDFLDHGTTVAGLARLVARASSSKGQSARDGEAAGDGRPVFFVYPDLASAMSLRHLRRLWGSEQSAYPLLPLAASSQPDRSYTVEQLAEPLLSTVREIQPIGPYALVGFSFGGLVAYELARQLDQADQRVEWLGVLDTPTPEMARQLMRRWKSSSARIARLREPGRVKLVADYLGNLRWSIREKLIDVGFAERHPSEEFDLRGAWEIMQRYRGCGHAAPLELFVTSTTAAEVRTPLLGWDAFHGGSLRTRFLEGSHDSILDSPQIEELAALILTGIHGAREDASR